MITDIHMHLIPGVDDGADSPEMSLEMIRLAMEQGVRTIFCTPHDIGYRGKSEEVGKRFLELRDACAEIMPEMRLYKGCELYCNLYKMDANLAYLADGTYPTMNDTGFILTEFPLRELRFPQVRQMCGQLSEHGLTPILAHTERFNEIIERIDNVAELKEMGCLVQVNVHSLSNEADQRHRSWAEELLKRRLIDFIGSDAHGTKIRPPRYTQGVNRIYETCDRDYADAVCFGNAEKLLVGE